MKRICNFFLVLLLISFVLPLNATVAIADDFAHNANDEDTISQLFNMATVRDGDEHYNIPHRDVFVNSLGQEDMNRQRSVQGELIQKMNGFWYYTGYSVNTRGQVGVDADKAYDDFASDAERNAEKQSILRICPTIEILGDPTSHYNCHSYAWCEDATWNDRWIDDPSLFVTDVHSIRPVSEENAQPGDIVIYFESDNVISHSAVISEVSPDGIYCISKWGASVLCRHEIDNVPNTYKYLGQVCRTVIIRRSEHTGTGVAVGTNEHMQTCTICGYEQQLTCVYSYTYASENRHNAHCTGCNRVNYSLSCTLSKTSNGNGYHTVSCGQCNHTYTEICSLEYTNITNTRHSVACTVCDYSISRQSCTVTYTSKGNKTHTATCSKCKNTYTGSCSIYYSYLSNNQHRGSCNKCNYSYTQACDIAYTYSGDGATSHVHERACQICGNGTTAAPEACTFAYKGVGDNTHVQACTQCQYIKLGPVACSFNINDICWFCGARKDAVILNEQEEDVLGS